MATKQYLGLRLRLPPPLRQSPYSLLIRALLARFMASASILFNPIVKRHGRISVKCFSLGMAENIHIGSVRVSHLDSAEGLPGFNRGTFLLGIGVSQKS